MIADTLHKLSDLLIHSSYNENEIKLALTDLYLRIKESINRSYSHENIPFDTNYSAIEYILHRNFIYEIFRFLSEQFEMIMKSIGNPSPNASIYDVLFYIDHNFRDNIRLDTIAPLFGYNSTYLGRIFRKYIGESFNSYLDRKRIELAKQLLAESSMKVYEIAKHAGYNNMDYFHKKFKQYVGVNPTAFRNASKKPGSL